MATQPNEENEQIVPSTIRQIITAPVATQQSRGTLLYGAAAAFAAFAPLPFDTSINLEGDGGKTDLMLGEYDIQVKSTKYKTGRLVFNNRKEISADVFILCWVNEEASEVSILGYIRKQSIEDCLIEMNLGHGKRLVVEQKFLKPISILTAYLERLP